MFLQSCKMYTSINCRNMKISNIAEYNQIYYERCPAENLCIKCSGVIILYAPSPLSHLHPHLYPYPYPCRYRNPIHCHFHFRCNFVGILVLLLIESKQRIADMDTEPQPLLFECNVQHNHVLLLILVLALVLALGLRLLSLSLSQNTKGPRSMLDTKLIWKTKCSSASSQKCASTISGWYRATKGTTNEE